MWLYHFCRWILILIFKIFFGLKVSGTSNIPLGGGFILASNHTSILDPMILGAASSRELNFMAKEELFKIPFFGILLRNVGAFPLKREQSDVSAIKEAIRRLKNGNGLVVFPEGTRNKNKNNFQVQSGIGMLSSKAKCPILPAFISGADRAMPAGAKVIKPARIKVRFGRPLEFNNDVPYEHIANKVMAQILSLK